MSPPYICLRCSRRLNTSLRQLRRASFVSLGKLVSDGNINELPEQGPIPRGQIEDRATGHRKRNSSPPSYRSKDLWHRTADEIVEADRVLETLFNSNSLKKKTDANAELESHKDGRASNSVSRYSRTPITQYVEPATKHSKTTTANPFAELHDKLREGKASLASIWLSCHSLLNSRGLGDYDVSDRGLKRANTPFFHDLLLAVCKNQKLQAQDGIATPSQILRVYQKHSVPSYRWSDVLWIQLRHVLDIRYSRVNGESLREEPAIINVSQVSELEGLNGQLRELIGIWRVFMGYYGQRTAKPSTTDASISSQGLGVDQGVTEASKIPLEDKAGKNSIWRVPNYSDYATNSHSLPKDLTERFLHLLPKHNFHNTTSRTAAAAVMTYSCLQALQANSNEYVRLLEEAEPFIGFLEILTQGVDIDRKAMAHCMAHAGIASPVVGPALKALNFSGNEKKPELSGEWIRSELSETDQHFRIGHQASQEKFSPLHKASGLPSILSSILKKIPSATGKSDAELASSLWAMAQADLDTSPNQDKELCSKVFARFLQMFFELRRSDEAISVWNYMVQKGYRPIQMHWNSMLHGCVNAKDVSSLLQIWSQMVTSGLQPDIVLWTTYLFGLIRCRKVEQGLEALEQLGRAWKLGKGATESRNDGNFAPSMAPVHAVLAALGMINRSDLYPRIIQWASAQDLCLETYTYNILLRPIVRTGEETEIQEILDEMTRNNCKPDIVTYTIRLNGLVSNPGSIFHTLPLEKQTETITSILHNLESASITPTLHTYSTLLEGLLNPPKSSTSSTTIIPTVNTKAARVVLSHMYARSLTPSPHIYTILVTHYFSSSPPDLPAISSLWQVMRHQRSLIDAIFYDRLIEGYADADQIDPMLSFLRRMPEEGKSPGWVALVKVLRCLVRNGEWTLVGDVVRGVEDEGALLSSGGGNFVGWAKEEFWGTVDRVRGSGLVDGERRVEGMERRTQEDKRQIL